MRFSPGLITLHRLSNGLKYSDWIVSDGTQIYSLRTERVYKQDTVTTLRYVINRALKLNSDDYMFLGNRLVSGKWITEWMRI